MATRPSGFRKADLTRVATSSGFVYVVIVDDVFAGRIVGWRLATSLRTHFRLSALEQVLYARLEGRRLRILDSHCCLKTLSCSPSVQTHTGISKPTERISSIALPLPTTPGRSL